MTKTNLNVGATDIEKATADTKAWALSPALLYRDCESAGNLKYRFDRRGTNPEERDAWFNDIVGWLISNGSRNKQICKYVKTCDSEKIESFLLTHGEYKFYCTCCGCSAYHLCILGDHEKVLLSLNRENINVKNWKGQTALQLASDSSNLHIFEYLLNNGADPNVVDVKGISPLLICLINNDLPKVKMLLEKGARVNDALPDRYERSLLHLAVLQGSMRLVRLLLKFNADIDAQDEYGMTPLNLAVMYGQDSLVSQLIDAGALTDIRCKNGWTALHVACSYQQESCVEMLLEAGVKTDDVDSNESSALHEATWVGNANIVQILTSHGCSLDVEDKYLRTALHVAVMNGYTKIAKHLLNCGARTAGLSAPLQRVVKLGCLAMVQLVAKHADINAPDRYGNTLLKTAVLRNNTDMVKVLLDEGADVSIRGVLNCPIIVEAICRDNAEIVRLLMERGADTTSCDDLGRSPLYFACRTNNEEIVRMIKECAFAAIKNKRSLTRVTRRTKVKSKKL